MKAINLASKTSHARKMSVLKSMFETISVTADQKCVFNCLVKKNINIRFCKIVNCDHAIR